MNYIPNGAMLAIRLVEIVGQKDVNRFLATADGEDAVWAWQFGVAFGIRKVGKRWRTFGVRPPDGLTEC